MNRVCFYHAGCPDGFGAAFAVWSAWRDQGRYLPRGHDDGLRAEDWREDFVAFVDIAPPNHQLRALADWAAKIVILDHHITSEERYDADRETALLMDDLGHEIHFDQGHSGAVLAWHYFSGEDSTPPLLKYVEDQDLWNWELPESAAVNAAIASYPHRFDVWERLAGRPIEELVAEGQPIVRANRVEVERAVRHAASIRVDGGRLVESVNSAHHRSAIGHELAERARHGNAWGCVYRIVDAKVSATLYSIGDLDVAQVAQKYGGGGHKNAAGFTVPLATWLADFV